ncbi:MAG: hypothetical protein ACRD8U_19150, partial [Pyrinomonadaceae bacterium]
MAGSTASGDGYFKLSSLKGQEGSLPPLSLEGSCLTCEHFQLRNNLFKSKKLEGSQIMKKRLLSCGLLAAMLLLALACMRTP